MRSIISRVAARTVACTFARIGSFAAVLLIVASPLFVGSRTARGEETPLRILTHNVYVGFKNVSPEAKSAWRDWVASQRPDIVALQELSGYTPAQLEADAASWGHAHSALHNDARFPVGLTSRWPLERVASLEQGFHRAVLRADAAGLTVYAVHLHPSNWQARIDEAKRIGEDIASLGRPDPRVVLAGDFNGFSPADREAYGSSPGLVPFFKRLDERIPGDRNLHDGQIDYGGIQTVLDLGFLDAAVRFRGADGLGPTFPTAVVATADHGPPRRLDYIFVSENLGPALRGCRVLDDDTTARFSDHAPVIADLVLPVTPESSR